MSLVKAMPLWSRMEPSLSIGWLSNRPNKIIYIIYLWKIIPIRFAGKLLWCKFIKRTKWWRFFPNKVRYSNKSKGAHVTRKSKKVSFSTTVLGRYPIWGKELDILIPLCPAISSFGTNSLTVPCWLPRIEEERVVEVIKEWPSKLKRERHNWDKCHFRLSLRQFLE